MSLLMLLVLVLAAGLTPKSFGQPQPLYRVTLERTIKSIGYPPTGSTRIDFMGTVLAPMARGNAQVRTNQGAVQVQARFERLSPASSFGTAYLTYVLWAISPEGRPRNLGEVVLDGNRGRINAATSLQAFGMMVTAEPYFAVSAPSEVVVLENVARPDTRGTIGVVDAKTELLSRVSYKDVGLQPPQPNSNVPLDLYQARNAVQVARAAGADKYAGDTFENALFALKKAEGFQLQRGNQRRQVVMAAREATQTAEDARVIATRRAAEEAAANEKAAAEARAAAAKAAAEREAQQAREAQAEAERQARDRQVAELQAALAKADAERQAEQRKAAEAVAAKAESDRLRAQLQEQQARLKANQARQGEQAAKQAAEDAEAARLKAVRDKEELRENLLKTLNMVLETRDTPRGLVVNLGDVLFDTGSFELRDPARLALARLSGIVLSHPGLMLSVEGHTDNVGNDEFNQRLSEQRAGAVRAFLIAQQLDPDIVTARGFGSSRPVASNDNAQGRQQNRRVEIIVSGEVIGVRIN